jgi:opacity protein-like surface antigen
MPDLNKNMKRFFLIILVFVCLAGVTNAQYKVTPNKPFTVLKSGPGLVSVSEATGGFGLNTNSSPNSKYFSGFTTVIGYQLNANFFAGGGLGLSFYDTNMLVPLFLDFKYAFSSGQFTPYIFGDGGLLLFPSSLNETKLFINPGAGVRYAFARSFAVNAGIGFISQVDGKTRATFVNIKLGVVYVF